MKTEFYIHERARPALNDWIAELSSREPGGQIMAQIALDVISAKLVRNEGCVDAAIRDNALDPPLFWWQYYPGEWISYVVRESGFWRWKKRRIIVYSVGENPPDRVVASSPPL